MCVFLASGRVARDYLGVSPMGGWVSQWEDGSWVLGLGLIKFNEVHGILRHYVFIWSQVVCIGLLN